MIERIKSKEKKISIALVGLGRISQKHIEAILKLYKRAKIVAICDTVDHLINNAENLIKDEYTKKNIEATKIFKFKQYLDLIESIKLKKIKVDLIVITTPSGLHPKQVIEAARAGVNVCTEKPMATRWKDGLEMVNVVPNPYNGISSYESSQLDNRVKIINLPRECTISIYSINGSLIVQ